MSDRGPVLPPIFVSPRARWIAILSLLALLVLAGVGLVLFDYSFGSMLDAQTVRETVESFGLLAPLVFILIQATQVVVAPIPGQVLALAGGYAFGPVLGTIYSLIGATIGSAVAFGLSRRFGRPAVKRLVHPLTLEMVDGFLEDHGRLAVFLVFLVPGLPDDALCFVCGLTPLPLSHLVVLSTIGRIPGYAMLSLAGGRLATNRPLEAILIIVLIAVLAALAYSQRERLLEFSR
ncbi:hypothetical protein HTSR_0236 [Halodesulfurarchaeum formicicum]|uniref:VTT domain-containing protein n=1 Tax=Halodesulfurarchaeum formicicum TaxID=1873524 RepID=A0A1D8S243_9EURY|nr:TVP38/TMEM64 family protein [Halodesulfurarchaeum formicicum]AOW79438.1 hypothetical protein HTSR_0236 [Halodesulfurarchaeum formicicum]APE94691.1 hypothetical protein HSR6_0223 [Halodesulfurarchaeum formicicum]